MEHCNANWDFIERYLPNYYTRDDVMLSNDLSKLIDEPYDASDLCREHVSQYVDDLSDTEALANLQSQIDAKLLKEAKTTYMEKA